MLRLESADERAVGLAVGPERGTLWTIEADHVTRYALYFDQVELLTQLGLMPAMAAGAAG